MNISSRLPTALARAVKSMPRPTSTAAQRGLVGREIFSPAFEGFCTLADTAHVVVMSSKARGKSCR
jgi:hypothetical protein